MSVYQQDAEAGQDNGDGAPAFRVVRRGYDRDEVDAYDAAAQGAPGGGGRPLRQGRAGPVELQRGQQPARGRRRSSSSARPPPCSRRRAARPEQLVENARRRAETIIEKAQQQAEQIRADVENEAQKALEQAREVADHIRREVEEERAALFSETEQVRDFRDGMLDDLGRVHGEISGLLEWTRVPARPGADHRGPGLPRRPCPDRTPAPPTPRPSRPRSPSPSSARAAHHTRSAPSGWAWEAGSGMGMMDREVLDRIREVWRLELRAPGPSGGRGAMSRFVARPMPPGLGRGGQARRRHLRLAAAGRGRPAAAGCPRPRRRSDRSRRVRAGRRACQKVDRPGHAGVPRPGHRGRP